LFSTAQYNSCLKYLGHSCCYKIMKPMENLLLCGSRLYRCRCFRHQRVSGVSSALLGTIFRLVPTPLICPGWETLMAAVLQPAYFSGLLANTATLVPKIVGSNPAEAVGYFGRKSPQHAFLRRESKSRLSHVANLRHVKDPCDLRGSRNRRPINRPFLAQFRPSLTEVSHVA
jgi:hypothetical protein